MSRSAPTRRQFLRGAAAASLLPLTAPLAGCEGGDGGDPAASGPVFAHGVASGDPTSDAVMLWTRVSRARGPVTVRWQIASDPELSDVLDSGEVEASAASDYTVKLEVTGLAPATHYYYAFEALGEASRVGRTKTAPLGEVARLRFAVMTCGSITFGYFHAYRDVAERDDIDAVIHLGDYIYEYAEGVFGTFRRPNPPWEIVEEADYRQRYAQYRSDPDMQAMHAAHPLITIWDDHEIANNTYRDGAENHMPGEGTFEQRRAIAQQVYDEWMPIRMAAPGADRARIFRTLRYGDLADIILLDTRSWGRDVQSAELEVLIDPERQMLGADQEQWLADELAGSRATHVLVAQQVMMAPFRSGGVPINFDQWDGYPLARRRVLELFDEHAPGRVLVLSGDLHAGVASELALDFDSYDRATGEGVVAVELVTPGVTARLALSPQADGLRALMPQNPHAHHVDAAHYGYVILDLDAERIEARYWIYDDVERLDSAVVSGAGFRIDAGVARLQALG